MSVRAFTTGLENLLGRHSGWLRGARVALVAHGASVNRGGRHSAELLRAAVGRRLTCLLAPEHGFAGSAPAGEHVGHAVHPGWGIPVFSLYGATRRPTPAMLARADVVVFDLQDIGVRCYTYVSTLRRVMEACAEAGRPLIVADRPVPHAAAADGPMLNPRFASFVGDIPAPWVYGLTPGETARWLAHELGLGLDLRVAAAGGWRRDGRMPRGWPAVPPSPSLRTLASARGYPATVCTEALPALDCDRGGALSFRVLGAPGMDAGAVAARARQTADEGIRLRPCSYVRAGVRIQGVRLEVRDPLRFRPAALGVALLAAVRDVHGGEFLWRAPGARPAFFDRLAGTSALRRALQRGVGAARIVGRWEQGLRAFERRCAPFRLYD